MESAIALAIIGASERIDGSFDRTEVRLAGPREDLGDRHVLACLDELVDVHRRPIEPFGERPRQRRLARGHETDQIDLFRSHATSRSRVSKKSG